MNWEIVFAEGEPGQLQDMDVFPGTKDVSLRGVICLDADTAIGYGTRIHRTTDRGLSWEAIENPDETIDGGRS